MKVWQGRVTAAEREASMYKYLPFDVPPGTGRIDVHYEFDAAGGTTVDLGLLDQDAGPFPAASGFRGWSGSARRSIFVSAADATPGYLPGEIKAGTWQVMLGLARVAPAGADYRVEVRFSTPEVNAAADSVVSPAALTDKGPRWYRGDLQSHTHYSDARGSLDDLIRAARERQLEFLAVTDHNTHAHHRELAERSGPELLLVPGEEVTTYNGHANVWGVDGWVDFRIEAPGDLDRLVAHVHERGGLFSVNHPKVTPDCIGCDWEYPVPEAADSLEAWQGPWPARNWDSLQRYDEQLRSGRRLSLVGGSDRHQPGYPDSDHPALQVGSPTTWLYLDKPDTASVLRAIKAGQAYVSEGPEGPRLELEVAGAGMGATVDSDGPLAVRARIQGAAGDTLHWIGSGGVMRTAEIDSADFTDEWEVPAGSLYIRIEVIAAASLPGLLAELESFAPAVLSEASRHPWRRAISNPVYLRPAGETA